MAYKNTSRPEPLDQIKTLLKQPMPIGGLYCFCGEEEYLKQSYLEALRKKILDVPGGNAFDHIRLTGQNLAEGGDADAGSRIADILSVPPTLCSGRLAELSEPGFRPGGGEPLGSLMQALRGMTLTDTVFILTLTEEEMDTTSYRAASAPLYKALSEVFTMVPFHRQTREKLIPWCQRHFGGEGIHADPRTVGTLIDRVGRDMGTLSGEIVKLSFYAKAKGRREVTGEDIALLCPHNEESSSFGFSDAVNRRWAEGLLREYRLAKQEGSDETQIFSAVYTALLDLYRVATALEEGVKEANLGQVLHLNPYRAGILASAARNYTCAELEALLEYGAQTDYALKNTGKDKSVTLCTFFCRFAPNR